MTGPTGASINGTTGAFILGNFSNPTSSWEGSNVTWFGKESASGPLSGAVGVGFYGTGTNAYGTVVSASPGQGYQPMNLIAGPGPVGANYYPYNFYNGTTGPIAVIDGAGTYYTLSDSSTKTVTNYFYPGGKTGTIGPTGINIDSKITYPGRTIDVNQVNTPSLPSTLVNVLNLKPCRYQSNIDGQTHTGFLASDVSSIFPEAVRTINGMSVISYDTLIPHLVVAIQEQNKLIVTLQEAINYYLTVDLFDSYGNTAQ
jgi:hypothetical protein